MRYNAKKQRKSSDTLQAYQVIPFNHSTLATDCILLGEICRSQNEGHVNGFWLLVYGDMLCMCTQEALY